MTMGDSNRESSHATHHGFGQVFLWLLTTQRMLQKQASCFGAVNLINWNIPDEIYIANI